jgi:hypothetical protein
MGSLKVVFFWDTTPCILLYLQSTLRHTPKERTVSTHRSSGHQQDAPACFLTSQWSFLPYNRQTAQLLVSDNVRIYDLFTYATPPQHHHIWSVLYKTTLNALCGGPARRLVRLSVTLYKSSVFRKEGQPSKHQFYRKCKQQIFKKCSSLLQMNSVSCQHDNTRNLTAQEAIGQPFKNGVAICNMHLAASHTTYQP